MNFRRHNALHARSAIGLVRVVAVLAGLALGSTAIAQAPATAAAPVDEAAAAQGEKIAEEGRDAYRSGRYADAIGLFEKAYALSSKPAFLYNIARAKEKLADYDNATKYLEKYLDGYKQQNAGAEPQNAADVKNLMRDFKQRAFEALPEVSISSVPPGVHQVTLTRVGYTTADQQVTLSEDKLTTVRLNQRASSGPPASWRSFTGWPLVVLGGLAIGGGYVAKTYADQEYAGSPLFLERQKLQNYGYYSGGAALGLGLGLIIWDWSRSGMNSDDVVPGAAFDDGVEDKPLPPPESTP